MNIFLETERLLLRELEPGDFKDAAEMLQDPQVMYAWEYTFSAAEVKDWIERMRRLYRDKGYAYCLAVDKATGEAVGQAGLLPEKLFNVEQFGVGYIFKRRFWHRGLATEAAAGCLEYAFGQLASPMVIADIRPENTASIRVAERLGFTCRDELVKPVRGKAMRHLVYALNSNRVRVLPYQDSWPSHFARLNEIVGRGLAGLPVRLEHVGSTAVPGLAAKPVIDADVILADWNRLPEVIAGLAKLGFRHRGNLGISGREAFYSSPRFDFGHHLYVVRPHTPALENHLKLRDYLRRCPAAAERYARLKQELAARFPAEIDSYCENKTALITELLAAAGIEAAAVAQIRQENLAAGEKKPD